MIKKMADDNPKFNLAVSLHAALNETRSSIMPINDTNSLEELAEALQYWYQKTKSKVTYEYVVWKGINDTPEHAQALLRFAKLVPSKVNLIEYNPIDDGAFQQADDAVLDMYMDLLEKMASLRAFAKAGVKISMRPADNWPISRKTILTLVPSHLQF